MFFRKEVNIVNLLAKLKEEVKSLKLTDKYEIAYYIYIRTGQLFDFDPYWTYGTEEEEEQVVAKRIDIEQVTDFKIVCSSWSYMYVDLLKEFDILARVIGGVHYSVVFWINKEEFIADLTKNCGDDILAIKFGLPIQNFTDLTDRKEQNKNLEKKFKYNKGIETEDILEQLREELIIKSASPEDYRNRVYKIIEIIMNFRRENIGYMSGTNYIRYLYYFFSQNSDNIPCLIPFTPFYDQEKQIYFAVYTLEMESKIHYLVYQENEHGYYEFHEASKREIQNYVSMYSSKFASRLKLTK